MSGDKMKTSEELADEYADKKHNYNPNFPRDVQHNYDVWWECHEDFLAGYQAGYERGVEILHMTYKDAAPQWISVKDRLPDDHKHYLVASDVDTVQAPVWYNDCSYWDVELAYYSQRYERWMTGNPTLKDVPENKVTFEVAHWMPLPKPPEE